MSVSRKKGRLSFFMRGECEPKNRSGVNSLQFDPNNDRLFTAGRDSVIRVWNTHKPNDPLIHNMEHHADWVNDIVLCCGGKNLISASNDTTVKVWNATKGFCMSTLGTHKEYVRVLAYAQNREEVASAGLDGAIFLWDIRTLTALTPTNNTVETRPLTPNDDSTYSLAMNPSGTVIVAGGPDKRICVWDPRSRSKPFSLRSHSDSVRALVVRANGEEIVSGSSDGTIKVWNLGMQRCTDTIRIHSDSVFTVQVDNSWSTVYSAGKDRRIWATNLRDPTQSVLVGEETDPVLKLLLVEGQTQSYLWSATCNTNVNRWPLNTKILNNHKSGDEFTSADPTKLTNSETPTSHNQTTDPGPIGPTDLVTSTSPTNSDTVTIQQNGVRNSKTELPGLHVTPKPDFVIVGGSPIIQFHVCPEKRFILTKDSEGNVAVYDVLKATMTENLGSVNFEDEVKKREKLVYVPNWFSVDLKCGIPIIHLDEGDCLSAYITATDAGLLNELEHDKVSGCCNQDTKINYGFVLLRSLFSHRPMGGNMLNNGENVRNDTAVDGILGVPGYTPVILSDGSGRPLVRFLARDAASLSAQLKRCNPEPKWIIDVVEACKLPKPVRIAFSLVPATVETNAQGQRQVVPVSWARGDGLAANDILLIRKVMEHVFQRLLKLADSLASTNALPGSVSPRNGPSGSPYNARDRFTHGQPDDGRQMRSPSSHKPPPMSPTSSSSTSSTNDPQTPTMTPLTLPPDTMQADLAKLVAAASSDDPNPENIVEIWCGDQRLDPNMNLRSARYFYWKKPGDLVLSYLIQKDDSTV